MKEMIVTYQYSRISQINERDFQQLSSNMKPTDCSVVSFVVNTKEYVKQYLKVKHKYAAMDSENRMIGTQQFESTTNATIFSNDL